MPKRLNLHKILILGSGPIVIGQGCEFDYSGVQACKALRSVGFEVVLVNSNPATIMTDPDMADHTYIEPITWQSVARVIEAERPDAILSTMGGQTALNCALDLDQHGILAKYNVELIGANKDAINKAEDRELFRIAMENIGLEMAKSAVAFDIATAREIQKSVGFPTIIRPSFTLGGSGGGIAYNQEEFETICERGFALSMNHQLLIEESLLGWKEFELEVIRDANDSCIIVCTIENLDPMGIHTGDSITVAPAQTLTDVEYQTMRNAAIAILREIGVETGGSNVQFALNPKNGRMVVIEMNPRVSRSSALASKATGFPIAKVAALLAVGYTLDELQNDITDGIIPASFEPSIDYVVVKIPRFNFDKFASITPRLATQMQSVGEVMAIGATFQAALQKALSSLEVDVDGFNSKLPVVTEAEIKHEMQYAGAMRLLYVADALRFGYSIEQVYEITGIDPWFLRQIQEILNAEQEIQRVSAELLSGAQLLQWKQSGFSDARIAYLMKLPETLIRNLRQQMQITPKFKRIDSCAAEFPAATAYLYSTYDGVCEARVTNNKKVVVLGSGPNRIGQGIEFDYCCVQAVQSLQDYGIEAIMINCNPETVSTDYDISNRLYFEALRLETVLDIIEMEQPLGVIIQLGGQTPLKLAAKLQQHGVKILGTNPQTIDLAEDRGKFSALINELGLKQPSNAMAQDLATGIAAAQELGYPLMVRPSYVLGGRAMEIVTNEQELQHYLQKAFVAANNAPILIDSFLQDAIEVDVDVIADGQGGVFVAGIMQHVEPAGVHSGDSASSLPPYSLGSAIQQTIKEQAQLLALRLNVIGLMNIQFAIQNDVIYILEVNPRASRTIPFVSKAIGLPLAKIAVACMLGYSLQSQQLQPKSSDLVAVKQSVFPFNKFHGCDPLLGPEMRSTGEVMCFGVDFAAAYLKTMEAITGPATEWKQVFISVCDATKHGVIALARELVKSKILIFTDKDTQPLLNEAQIPCITVIENDRILSLIASGAIDLVVCTQNSGANVVIAKKIRALALRHRVNFITTISGARAMLLAMQSTATKTAHKLQTVHNVKVFENEH